jgi:hypothetical protein
MSGLGKSKSTSQSQSQGTQTQQTRLDNPFMYNLGVNLLEQADARRNTADKSQVVAGADILGREANKTLSGSYLSPDSNPFIKDVVSAFQTRGGESLAKGLNTIGDLYGQGGAFGGARQGIAEGEAVRGYATDTAALAAQLYADNYTRERNNMLNAGTQLAQVAALNDNAAYGDLGTIAQLLTSLAPYYSTSTGTSNEKSSGSGTQTASALQGIATLGSVASLFKGG